MTVYLNSRESIKDTFEVVVVSHDGTKTIRKIEINKQAAQRVILHFFNTAKIVNTDQKRMAG